MAAHGVARSTADLDLLATAPSLLDPGRWDRIRQEGATVNIHPGDGDDPLAGVVRLSEPEERDVDLVVGRGGWQEGILARAQRISLLDASVPVVEPADLILLKLYAGGPQDAWDIQQLLASDARADIITDVDARVVNLPAECLAFWQKVRPGS